MHLFHKWQVQVDVSLCYFYNDVIIDFRHLLTDDARELIVISSLQHLAGKRLATVYGYVIMTTHFHLLWYLTEQNGKKNTAASFTKFTAYQFTKHFRQTLS